MPGLIVAGVIGAARVDDLLRRVFAEALRRGADVSVVAAGPASTRQDRRVRDVVHRWEEQYPAIDVSLTVSREVDAVITLAAASRDGDLLVVRQSNDARTAAMVDEVARLAHSDILIVDRP
ncbi:hypothetical protein [Actinoplanes sp. DH11]|uniref:hypothetical protein n=1 Tax=Actinoplanes sp. DH11 TaxID=2857011 RepID=UPI001E2B7D15|nr:hypothetical protein [Actinoplanes sp. DH11]